MASSPNVICDAPETVGVMRSLFGRPSSRSYRIAVAEIVRNVKAQHKLSNERMAEIIGCSEQTVANAENECGDLTAVILLSVAYAFGEEAIEPVRQLYLCAPADQLSKNDHIRKAREHLNIAEGME